MPISAPSFGCYVAEDGTRIPLVFGEGPITKSIREEAEEFLATQDYPECMEEAVRKVIHKKIVERDLKKTVDKGNVLSFDADPATGIYVTSNDLGVSVGYSVEGREVVTSE